MTRVANFIVKMILSVVCATAAFIGLILLVFHKTIISVKQINIVWQSTRAKMSGKMIEYQMRATSEFAIKTNLLHNLTASMKVGEVQIKKDIWNPSKEKEKKLFGGFLKS